MSSWTREQLETLAAGWLEELRAMDGGEDLNDEFGDAVVMMNFTAPNDVQWDFIQIAVRGAKSDRELSAIAAGPFEHLMGFHGEAYIDQVEHLASSDPGFRQMVPGSWRHMMSDEVWAKVQAIQSIADP